MKRLLISFFHAKRRRFVGPLLAAALFLGAFFSFGTLASATTIHFIGTNSDGNPVTGDADFTLDAGTDTVTVKMTNLTTTTLDAGQLFTGLDFSLDSLTPTIISAMGIRRTVNDDGTFSDTATPQNLTWSLISLGGGKFSYQLNFNPDATDAIIGPPTAGDYSLANGSIKGNGGHNPYAAEMATFQLTVPGLETSTPVAVTAFRFGTQLKSADGVIFKVPEPCTFAIAILGVAIGSGRYHRKTHLRF